MSAKLVYKSLHSSFPQFYVQLATAYMYRCEQCYFTQVSVHKIYTILQVAYICKTPQNPLFAAHTGFLKVSNVQDEHLPQINFLHLSDC